MPANNSFQTSKFGRYIIAGTATMAFIGAIWGGMATLKGVLDKMHVKNSGDHATTAMLVADIKVGRKEELMALEARLVALHTQTQKAIQLLAIEQGKSGAEQALAILSAKKDLLIYRRDFLMARSGNGLTPTETAELPLLQSKIKDLESSIQLFK